VKKKQSFKKIIGGSNEKVEQNGAGGNVCSGCNIQFGV
jgi:hypothetical protein